MQKLILTFIIAVCAGIFSSIGLIAVNIRVVSSLFIAVVISDIIVLGMYANEIIVNSSDPDLLYVLGYIIITVMIGLIISFYVLIRNNSDRCICKCCYRSHYDEIIGNYYK